MNAMTIKDAISFFGPKWPGKARHTCIVYRKVGDLHHWGFWNNSELSPTWQKVCTQEEFEAYVQEMQRKPYEFADHVSGE